MIDNVVSVYICADQDAAMPPAIEKVFPGTIHRLCVWHILNRFQSQLNELYSLYGKREFKSKFNSVINHPLTTTEFEAAWTMLMEEFDLGTNATMQTLYDLRHSFVPAFLKDHFCGTMVSTQRGESVNNIVKLCHVDANTPLHEFAKQMQKFLHRRKMAEGAETYGCTVSFYDKLARLYDIIYFIRIMVQYL